VEHIFGALLEEGLLALPANIRPDGNAFEIRITIAYTIVASHSALSTICE
jgi:hypothetical protein